MDTRTIECNNLGEPFWKSVLNVTQKTCIGDKVYECNECEKSADKRENLIIHQIHAREKFYECGSYEKAFIPKSSLSRCLRGLPRDKPYACKEDENLFNGKWKISFERCPENTVNVQKLSGRNCATLNITAFI